MTTPRDISSANNPNYKGHMHRQCSQCGGPINGSSKTRKYCSRACHAVASRTTDYAHTCRWCGKEYTHRRNKCCSVECALAYREANLSDSARRYRAAKAGVSNPVGAPKVPRTITTCLICGKGMFVTHAELAAGRKKYCSRACYDKSIGPRQTGELHHNYKHGLTAQKTAARQALRKHPMYKAWVKAVLDRDGYACRSCGAVGGNLNAHHHAAWSADPKSRLKKSNGITLCTECHRLWHMYDRKGVFVGKESALQESVATQLRDCGFFVYNVPGTALGENGIPDLVVCANGVFVGVECKVFPNYLSELQKRSCDRIRQAGGLFFTVYSVDDVGKIIEAVERTTVAGGLVSDEAPVCT